MGRTNSDEYFMDIARRTSQQSTCLRRHVGAVIVCDKHILSTGYNGAVVGSKHCDEKGCLRQQLNIPSGQRQEICNAVHAEQNAIVQAAKFGYSINGASIYVTDSPCYICGKMLVNAGIKEVIIDNEYSDQMAMDLFKEVGIKIRKLTK